MDLFKTSKAFPGCELKGVGLLEKISLNIPQEIVSMNNGARGLRHIMLTYSFNLCTVVFNRWIYQWFVVSSFFPLTHAELFPYMPF